LTRKSAQGAGRQSRNFQSGAAKTNDKKMGSKRLKEQKNCWAGIDSGQPNYVQMFEKSRSETMPTKGSTSQLKPFETVSNLLRDSTTALKPRR
jgi:hypothetical protein